MANLAHHIPEQRAKSTLRIPESHALYLCPNACGRRQGIRALRNGVADHASFLAFSQADVVLGDYEGQIVEAMERVLARVEPRPRVLTLHVNCIDDFLGTDTEVLLGELAGRHPDVRFLLSRINPIAGDVAEGAASPARKVQTSLYAPLAPRGVRDGGVNVVGSFVAAPPGGELAKAVRAAGAGPLRQLPACETYDEYARMADSRLTVSVSHLGDGVAADLEERLGIPWMSWHACYDVDEVARRHERLAGLLGGPAPDVSAQVAAARAAIERARAAVGSLPIAVDTAASFAPFSLAVSLLDAGFDVRAVFAFHTKGEDAGRAVMEARYPRVRVLQEEDCRSGADVGIPRECLAIGQDAAYILRARHVLDMYHDEGFFGFDGIVRLMDGMVAACASPCGKEA